MPAYELNVVPTADGEWSVTLPGGQTLVTRQFGQVVEDARAAIGDGLSAEEASTLKITFHMLANG